MTSPTFGLVRYARARAVSPADERPRWDSVPTPPMRPGTAGGGPERTKSVCETLPLENQWASGNDFSQFAAWQAAERRFSERCTLQAPSPFRCSFGFNHLPCSHPGLFANLSSLSPAGRFSDLGFNTNLLISRMIACLGRACTGFSRSAKRRFAKLTLAFRVDARTTSKHGTCLPGGLHVGMGLQPLSA